MTYIISKIALWIWEIFPRIYTFISSNVQGLCSYTYASRGLYYRKQSHMARLGNCGGEECHQTWKWGDKGREGDCNFVLKFIPCRKRSSVAGCNSWALAVASMYGGIVGVKSTQPYQVITDVKFRKILPNRSFQDMQHSLSDAFYIFNGTYHSCSTRRSFIH